MSDTLLTIVQNILSSADSDEVNSISDTAESLQVARCVRDSYNYIVTNGDFPEDYTYFELIASGNNSYPVIMYLPVNCDEVLEIRYNNLRTDDTNNYYQTIYFMDRPTFIDRMDWLYEDDTSVQSFEFPMNGDSIRFHCYKDRAPSYYTVLDDRTLLFDAYDQEFDTTLQKSKSSCFGKLRTAFSMTDTFVPALNDKHFSLLYNEAKAQFFLEGKQQPNPVADHRARRGWLRMQSDKQSVPNPYENYTYANFGRRR